MTVFAVLPHNHAVSTSAVIPRLPDHSLPGELRVGDTLGFELQTTLAAGLQVFFVLSGVINNAPRRILIGRDAAGNDSVSVDATGLATFTVLGTVTAAWVPGRYQWVLFSVDGSGNRTQIALGNTVLLPDVAGAAVVDSRSYARRCLDSIRAVLLENVASSVLSYKIGTREFVNIPRAELMKQEAIYEARVRREQGLAPRRRGPAVHFGGR